MVAIRVVATPLLRVARPRQVHLVAKKLPEKQVQHFVEQRGRTVERVRGPERRAQDNGITREWNEGSWRSARDHECREEAAIIGGRGAADVRYACAKPPGHRPKAVGDQVCGLPVACPWHGPRRIPEEGTEQADGLVVARREFICGIVGQPNCVPNCAADDGAARVRGVRSASGATGVAFRETKSGNGGLGQAEVLPDVKV